MICDSVMSLGCQDACADFDTGLVSTEDGPLTLVFRFQEVWHRVELDIDNGDNIVIPGGTFNESDDVEFEVLKGNQALQFAFGPVQYTRFRIKTQPGTPGCCPVATCI